MHMPRNEWISVDRICALIEAHAQLDREDFEPEAPRSSIPKWRRNVRNVLLSRKRKSDIDWNDRHGRHSEYFLEE